METTYDLNKLFKGDFSEEVTFSYVKNQGREGREIRQQHDRHPEVHRGLAFLRH